MARGQVVAEHVKNRRQHEERKKAAWLQRRRRWREASGAAASARIGMIRPAAISAAR
jgi:hypothetical protein